MWSATVLLDLLISFTCLTAGIVFVTFCYRLFFWLLTGRYKERQQAKENERRMRNPNLATEEFIEHHQKALKGSGGVTQILNPTKETNLPSLTQTPPSDFVCIFLHNINPKGVINLPLNFEESATVIATKRFKTTEV